MKKKILVIAPACLPITGAEAIVNAKLLSALSADGRFEIDLISKIIKTGPYPEEPDYDNFDINLNKSAQIEVDNSINFNTILGHIRSFIKFGVVTKGSHWAVAALPTIENWLKTEKYDYVLTKNYPSLLIGKYLKCKYGIKWISTWNDPFPTVKYPVPYSYGETAEVNFMDKRLIAIMNTYPDFHLFPCERLRSHMMKYLSIPIDKTLIVPHVAFPDKTPTRNTTNILRLIHSGNLGHPRNPQNLIYALNRFIENTPNAQIHLTFQGKIENSDLELVKSLNLEKYISIERPIPYSESKRILVNYDIAVIIEAECDEGIFLPTKVGDFMESEMPIFAISPQIGTLNDLHKSNYIPYFANNKSIEDIALQINRIYNDFTNGSIKPSLMNPKYLSKAISDQYFSIE